MRFVTRVAGIREWCDITKRDVTGSSSEELLG